MSLRQFISSRAVVRALTAVRDSAAVSWHEAAALLGLVEDLYADPRHRTPAEPVTVLLLGFGHRGSICAEYARRFPREMRVVAVADSNAQADGPRVVGVCHVLRYTPYFRELKALIDSGSIGQVISVQHLEPIEHTHMSHSYVRGAWRNSREATPIILAKSCHDTDIIRWLVGAHAENVHCFGNLKWFTSANAPAGSTERCTDGCAVEGDCAYSALKIYHRERKRLYVFDLPEGDKGRWGDLILQGLKTTDYGRFVYRMDNDQPDHLTVNILFATWRASR